MSPYDFCYWAVYILVDYFHDLLLVEIFDKQKILEYKYKLSNLVWVVWGYPSFGGFGLKPSKLGNHGAFQMSRAFEVFLVSMIMI